MTDAQNILFVCVENAGRSQMAKAFFKKYASKKFNVVSAGTTPSFQLNPLVVTVMNEIGIKLNTQYPKLLSTNMIKKLFKTINMDCIDKNLVHHCLLRMYLIGIFLIQKKNLLMRFKKYVIKLRLK